MLRLLRTSAPLALAAALIAAGVASAHASFVRSDPTPNAVLTAAPSKATIWFSEPLETAFSAITVLFEDGTIADRGDSLVSPTDATQLSVSLGDAREGTYVVSWRVLSSVDGHITSSSYVFSVGGPIDRSVGGKAGGAVTSPLSTTLAPVARALGFIGQAMLVGVMLFRWLVWRPALMSANLDDSVDARAIARSKRTVIIALGLSASGAALTLIVQSSLAGVTIPQWLSTQVGRVWIGRAATLIALAVLTDEVASTGSRRERATRPPSADRWTLLVNVALGWLGLQLLLTTSLTSHSAAVASPPIVPIVADWAHLIATALWVGGLAQMAFVVPAVAKSLDDKDRARLWLKTVVYFSTVAAIGIGILLVTGTYMSVLHVGDWPLLLRTAYGRALLFKLALAGAAMLLGAYNLFIMKPRLDRAVDAPGANSTQSLQRRFRRLVTFEAIAALAALASAGILTNLPPSKDAQPITAGGERLELTARADDLDAILTIDPAQAGANTFDIRLSQNNQPVVETKEVSFRFTHLTRGLGTTKAAAALTADGAYATSGAYLSLSGDWQIEVAVRRPDAFDAFATYQVKVEPDGRIVLPGEFDVVESITRWLSVNGMAFGGGAAIALGLIWLVIGMKASRNPLSRALLSIPTLIALPVGVLSVVAFFGEPPSLASRQLDTPTSFAALPGNTSGAPFPAPASSTLQPLLPPEGATGSPLQTPVPSATPSGDPAALELLLHADAAMNALISLAERQTLRDDAGNQIAVLFTYAAPNRLRYQIVNGATAIEIGLDNYRLGPDGTWIKNRRVVPYQWPNFMYSQVASSARVEGEEPVGGVPATIVAFRYGNFDFRAWIDPKSDRILKLTMDGAGHRMVSVYREFNAAPPIEPPVP